MVTLADLKAHLNIVFDADDALITSKLSAAIAWIGQWVGGDLATLYPNGVPAPLDEAVRQLAAHLYVNREAVLTNERRATVLPFGVDDLVMPYRTWSF